LRDSGDFLPPFTISPQAVDCEACALDVGEAGRANESDVLEIRRASINHNMMPQLLNNRNQQKTTVGLREEKNEETKKRKNEKDKDALSGEPTKRGWGPQIALTRARLLTQG
jgi:hypothetical protein